MKKKQKQASRTKRNAKPRQLPQKAKMEVDLNALTIGDVKGLVGLLGGAAKPQSTAFKEGEKYFVRTVTHYYTGRCARVTDGELVLLDAAWIADTGRFHEFVAHGAKKANEVEPYPNGCEVIVPRGGIIDASVWPHELPREVK